MSWVLAWLYAVVTRRGPDGLTKKERAIYAARYQARILGTTSPEERQTTAIHRVRRARKVKRA